MLPRAIIADSRLYLRVRPNAPQITVKYSATSGTEAFCTEWPAHLRDRVELSHFRAHYAVL